MVTVTEVPIDYAFMHEDVSGDFHLEVYYDTKGKYNIVVTKMSTNETKTSELTATYEPIFGIDAGDMKDILAEAEALCEQFEAI